MSRKRPRIEGINTFGNSEEKGTGDVPATSIYSTYPLESTILLDMGNVATGSACIGKVDSISMNASVSSGSELFQYNRYFWNKDIFTFNYSNCLGMVAIAHHYKDFNTRVGKTWFVFYPIFLPRVALATYQAVTTGLDLTHDPAKRKYLIADLLYYLNGCFTSYNYDTLPTSVADGVLFEAYPPQFPLQGGPSLYAYNIKGFLERPTANNPEFPIFQDAKQPPLKWVYMSSNSQIGLVRNPAYWNNTSPGALALDQDIAFQIVTPEEFMFRGPGNIANEILSSVIVAGTVGYISRATVNVGVNSTFDNSSANTTNYEKGWCSQGCYATGFGQSTRNSTPDHIVFSDVYGTQENREALFAQTRFPLSDSWIPHDTIDEFETWAKGNLLERYFVFAKKICSLLPSRFYTVDSDILTRDQRMQPVSNNILLGVSSVMGLEYMDLNYTRTRVDSTAADDTCVNHLNPFYTIQSVDLYMRDEFGGYLQNYRSPSNFPMRFSDGNDPYTSAQSNYEHYSGDYLFKAIEGADCFENGKFLIPAWLAALNPNTSGGNTQPLISSFSTYMVQALYGLFHCTSGRRSLAGLPTSATIPDNFSPNIPISGNLIHFGRVLGN